MSWKIGMKRFSIKTRVKIWAPAFGTGPPSGLGRSASGCLGPMPLRGGSGQHRAPARPPVLLGASSYFHSLTCSCDSNRICRCVITKKTDFTRNIVVRGCPPTEVCFSQIKFPGVHLGGGVSPDRRRAATEAGGQGDTSPDRKIFINKKTFQNLFLHCR
jgi:hypothetical protein